MEVAGVRVRERASTISAVQRDELRALQAPLKDRYSHEPETALITLYNRGSESQRPDRLIEDDLAAELLASIDYPFAERFGRPDLSHVVAHFEA